MSKLLAFETTGRALSIALAICEDGDVRFFERHSRAEFNHLTELFPVLKELLDGAGTRLDEIDALAVSAGPGSFTGIRIGISAVRALAQATGIPVIKVPTLESFVFHEDYTAGEIACPVFDARRAQIYAGAFRRGKTEALETLVPGGAYDPADFIEQLCMAANETNSAQVTSNIVGRTDSSDITGDEIRKPGAPPAFCFFGDGLDVLRAAPDEIMSHPEILKTIESVTSARTQSAIAVAKWALACGVPEHYRTLEPIYLRQAEAQRKLEERLALNKQTAKEGARNA